VLDEQASHEDFTVLLGSGILAIAAVELLGHPFGKGAFVSLDGRQLLGALQIVRDSAVSGTHSRFGPRRRVLLTA